jgi:ABC-type Na+ efflux pump permease subunit
VKLVYLLLVAMWLLPVTMQAGNSEEKLDVRKYKTELKLSTQQLTQLNSVYNNYQSKSAMQVSAKKGKEKMQQIVTLRNETRKAVMAILTPDQRKQYRSILGMVPKK